MWYTPEVYVFMAACGPCRALPCGARRAPWRGRCGGRALQSRRGRVCGGPPLTRGKGGAGGPKARRRSVLPSLFLRSSSLHGAEGGGRSRGVAAAKKRGRGEGRAGQGRRVKNAAVFGRQRRGEEAKAQQGESGGHRTGQGRRVKNAAAAEGQGRAEEARAQQGCCSGHRTGEGRRPCGAGTKGEKRGGGRRAGEGRRSEGAAGGERRP